VVKIISAMDQKNLKFGKVVLTITMSLDGFIAGPNANSSNPLGEGGLRLHDWILKEKNEDDVNTMREVVESSGAVIVGGTTYHDAIDGAWGGQSPFTVPAFVITSRIPQKPRDGFRFNNDGAEKTLTLARSMALGKNVWVMGGADIIQQFIRLNLFVELHLSIAPVILQNGKRLFESTGASKVELHNFKTVSTPGAVHMKFRRCK
jgi:dihydrofolate reductase